MGGKTIASLLRKGLPFRKHFQWLFVIGVNNSGTTLLAKMLETHPELKVMPQEGQLLTDALPRPDVLGVVRIWTERLDAFRWTRDSAGACVDDVKKSWRPYFPTTQKYLVEKSPPNTVRSLWLQEHFVPSSFIAIVRNPYAVCEGIRRRNQYSLQRAAIHWVTANQIMLEDMKLLRRCVFLKYEDLTSDVPGSMEKLRYFLGLRAQFDLEACTHVTAHTMCEDQEGVHDMNHQSVSRLSREELDLINDIAGTMMRRFGYELL